MPFADRQHGTYMQAQASAPSQSNLARLEVPQRCKTYDQVKAQGLFVRDKYLKSGFQNFCKDCFSRERGQKWKRTKVSLCMAHQSTPEFCM